MSKKILSTQRNRIYRLFKDSLKCCSCSYDYDTSALEFHHIIPANKLEDIPKLIATGDYDSILEEFDKCAVLCSNCHNIIHNSMEIKNITDVAKSLTSVDTSYFKELCNMLNILVDENNSDETEEQNENIDVLVYKNKMTKQEKLNILKKHLIDFYSGSKVSDLNRSEIANELSFEKTMVWRYINQLKEEQLLGEYVDKELLIA